MSSTRFYLAFHIGELGDEIISAQKMNLKMKQSYDLHDLFLKKI